MKQRDLKTEIFAYVALWATVILASLQVGFWIVDWLEAR